MIVHWSRIEHKRDTSPKAGCCTWDELCDGLEEDGQHIEGKDGPSIIPCTYSDYGRGARTKQNISAMHLLILDIDKGVMDPEQWLKNNVEWTYFAWSSWNDGVTNAAYSAADGARFRVMIPLSKPVTPDLLDAFAEEVIERFPDADRQVVANATALYFTPRRRNKESDRDPWTMRGGEGAYPVVPKNLAKRALKMAKERRKAVERQRKAALDSMGKVTDTRIRGVLNAILNGIADETEGNRTTRVMTSAKQIIRLDMAYSFGAEGAIDALRGVAYASMGERRKRDIERAIDTAREYASGEGPEFLEERGSRSRGPDLSNAPDFDAGYINSLMAAGGVGSGGSIGGGIGAGMGSSGGVAPGLDGAGFGLSGDTPDSSRESIQGTETIKNKYAKAPVHPAHTLPRNYILTEQGAILKQVVKNAGTDKEDVVHIDVSLAPIFLSSRLIDDEGEVQLVVCWKGLRGWKQAPVSREDVASSRRIVKLAALGAPVTSTRARALVDFLERYERENEAHIPTSRLVKCMGWHEEGFAIGRHLITKDGYTEQSLSTIQVDDTAIDKTVLDAYHTRGSFQGWCRAIAPMVHHDYIMTMLCASLASVLLEPTSTPGFAIDLSWHTSTGKSTALDICASAFGKPGTQGLRMDWQATATYMERMSAVMRSLPYFADDTKTANDAGQISQLLYAFVSRGKGRATVTGLQQTVQKLGVLVSTGEMPAVQFSRDDGAAARTVTLQGLTFGEESDATARMVDTVMHGIQHHYGHAVVKFVQWIMHTPQHKLSEMVLDLRHTFGDLAQNGKGRRKAHAFAAMGIVREWLESEGIRWRPENLMKVFVRCHQEDLPKSVEAFRKLRRYAMSNVHKFQKSNTRWQSQDAPNNGWIGVYDEDKANEVTAICIKEEDAEEYLTRKGLWESNLPDIWVGAGLVKRVRRRLTGTATTMLGLDLGNEGG